MTQQTRLAREEAADKVLAVLSTFARQYGEEMDTETMASFRTALIAGEGYEWEIRGHAIISAISYSAQVDNAWFMNFTVDSINGDTQPSHDLTALIDDVVGDYFLNAHDRKSRSVIRALESWLRKAFDEVTITQADRDNMLHSIRSGKRTALVAVREGYVYTITFHRPSPEGYIVSLTYPDPVRKGSIFDSRLSDEGTQKIIQALGRIDLFPPRFY